MSKMSKTQWEEIRTTWENDPREGYVWLVSTLTELGFTLTSNAILMRAKREGWAKKVSAKKIANQADRNADGKYKVDSFSHSVSLVSLEDQNFVSALTSKKAEEKAIDLRTAIIEKHRNAVTEHEAHFPLSAMIDAEIGKAAKISIDVIKSRMEIERKAWNLDAAVEDTSAGMATEAEMNAIYGKAIEESRRMQKEVEKRNRERYERY
jgi:hypothetical protein